MVLTLLNYNSKKLVLHCSPLLWKQNNSLPLFYLDILVKVKLLDKDQYGGMVGKIQLGYSDLSVKWTKKGLASLYNGRGDVYDVNAELLQTAQYMAKEQKLGIWSLGNDLVSPVQYTTVGIQTL